ncbi:acyltransferase [Acidisphaera sp. L21]|uniref:acyltransferase family protein n=1 Tax=Acidisphaera sp. L21 TaxID=1641851 RepID=UPI00131ED150|nr:acyltransferase [Acidisphaera sp. L21]
MPDSLERMVHSRIIFANQLRGIAALCVVLIHYAVAYQIMQPTVAWVIAAPPLTGPISPVARWLFPYWLDGGAFGVALFFLISGFVIPLSLDRSTRGGFLAARFLRIYPTFWLGLTVQWLLIGASAAYWHRPIVFGWPVFIRNALLVNTWFDGISVDLVSWTLNVEIKFYLIMALLKPYVLASRIWPLFGVGVFAVALTLLEAGRLPPQLVQEAMFITYMLIGTLFQYHFRKALSTLRLLAGCAVLLTMGALCWALGPDAIAWPYKPANYLYASVVFGITYILRDRFRPSPILDAAAAISYPLYLVHSLVGFTVMTFLIAAWGLTYVVAAGFAFVISIAIASLLHITIEQASVRLGRSVTHSKE